MSLCLTNGFPHEFWMRSEEWRESLSVSRCNYGRRLQTEGTSVSPDKAKYEGEMEKQRSDEAMHSGKTPNDTGPESRHSSECIPVSALSEGFPQGRTKFPRGNKDFLRGLRHFCHSLTSLTARQTDLSKERVGRLPN